MQSPPNVAPHRNYPKFQNEKKGNSACAHKNNILQECTYKKLAQTAGHWVAVNGRDMYLVAKFSLVIGLTIFILVSQNKGFSFHPQQGYPSNAALVFSEC